MKTKRKYLVSVLFMLMLCLLCGAGASAAKVAIKLNKTKATIYTSGTKTVQLKATATGTSSKVTWKSSNSKVATVNSSGKVTAKKTGTATITAKVGGQSAKCKVTVKAVSIKLNKTSATIAVKKTLQLKATVVGPNSKVTWKSSNSSVASVSSSGKVTAKKTGKATISATANGKTAKCVVTVKSSQTTNENKLYKNFLAQKKSVTVWADGQGLYLMSIKLQNVDFSVADINLDGTKELIIRDSKNTVGNHIYTLQNGKVQYIGAATFIGDAPKISSYGGMFGTWPAAGINRFYLYSIKNGKLYIKLSLEAVWDTHEFCLVTDSGIKDLTESQWETEYEKYENSLKTGMTFKKNTAANRNKYLS